MPRIARAQAYPSKPITMVVPYLAGGPADGLARPLAERMSKALGQPVVVENIPGQSGVPGVGRALKAPPDGYTLSYGHNGSHVVNGAVYSLPYDLRSDLEPIALLPSNPLMISARKDFPAANLKELIAWLKANPGKAGVGNVGPASGTNVNAIYFQNITGVRFQFVPHKSVQTAIKALTTGELDLMFDQASHSLSYLRAGTIKVFAVTSKARTVSAPDSRPPTKAACRDSTARTGTGCGRPRARRRISSFASIRRWSRRSPIPCRQAVVRPGPRHAARRSAHARSARRVPQVRDREVVADPQGRRYQGEVTQETTS